MTVGKDIGIRMSKKTLAKLDATCLRYRWRRSQAVAEYISFYERLQEYLQQCSVSVLPDGSKTVVLPLELEQGTMWCDVREQGLDWVASDYATLVEQLQMGLLAGFREPLDLDALDEEDEEP